MSKNKKTYHDKIAEKIVELLKIGEAPAPVEILDKHAKFYCFATSYFLSLLR